MARRFRRRYVAGAALLILAALFHRSLPDPLFRSPYSTVVMARDGSLLGAKIAGDGQWRFPAAPCPERFALAAIAYEDRRFRFHPGVDPIAAARAAMANLRAGKVVGGASTLTMQVIRLSRRGKPRSFPEKIAEAFLAARLEMSADKDAILALYASHAPFGGNVIGVTAASWRYFGRGPENLSWGEAALLAVLPNSPALMHPGRNRDLLLRKRDRLLERLRRDGRLDSLTCSLARLEPLPDKPMALPRLAPHLVERLAAGSPGWAPGLSPGERDSRDRKAAAVWRTTVDADLQAQVNGVLDRRRAELAGAGIRNGAVLVLDTRTGAALAYVGNMPGTASEEAAGGDVDIIVSPRSTGSLLKPFLYASMLETGELLPGTLVPDIPSQMGGYAPENFDRGYEGAVPARMALARSLNVPAVRMLKEFGIDRFLHGLRALGMTTADRSAGDYGLTLVLGGAEGTLWELTGMYAGLAREAQRFAGGAGTDGARAAVIGPAAAWFALQAMAEVSRPDAEKSWRSFASSRWVAWKTGTSFGFRDAWAVGVTPEYTVGVWIGNASGQGRPGMTGIQVAAPVLFETFNLLPATTVFDRPMASLLRIPLCRQSGMRPSPFCPAVDSAWVPVAGLRTASCPYHRLVHLDPESGFQVHDGCQNVAEMRHTSWFVLPPAQEWYYRQRHSDYLPLPAWRKDCEAGAAALGRPRSMDLIYPRGTAKLYVPVDLDARRGRTVFEAVHRDPAATVFWHLDREYLGMTREFHKMEIDPGPGRHVLLLVDDRGERLEHAFEVLSREDAGGK
ncbi:MAG TPA: penicillin-binding protein 1C [Fibrobacteria bacterium]|nr:penicillin-binding protein 1C [Fibrobacteria bacterium]